MELLDVGGCPCSTWMVGLGRKRGRENGDAEGG